MATPDPFRDDVAKRIDAKRIDMFIGERIRQRRLELGWTQETLATQLKISYQQIQKYESGANRITAGRLFEIARLLGRDVSYFFDGAQEALAIEPVPPSPSRLSMEMMRHFSSIDDPEIKAAFANLARELSKVSNSSD